MGMKYVFETTFLVFLVLGVILSFAFNNFVLHAIIIFLFGVIVSATHALRKADLNYPYVLLVVGFLLGYLIATKSGKKSWILILFFLGIVAGLIIKKLLERYSETRK
ncbi:hypothetical protein HQ533_02850 [Candidatus Woesearchaeota archaeon]|nr:hypothetical protein [Candidatus Woesearchaeota archaeon]